MYVEISYNLTEGNSVSLSVMFERNIPVNVKLKKMVKVKKLLSPVRKFERILEKPDLECDDFEDNVDIDVSFFGILLKFVYTLIYSVLQNWRGVPYLYLANR